MVQSFKSRQREVVSVYSCRLNLPGPSAHWSGESAIVALQGFAALLGFINVKLPQPKAAEKTLSCLGALKLLHALVLHTLSQGWHLCCSPCTPRRTRSILEKSLPSQMLLESHSLCSAGYTCTVIECLGWQPSASMQDLHAGEGEGTAVGPGRDCVCFSSFMTCIISGWIAFVQL